MPDNLTVAEAADYLHCHSNTVRRLIAAGQLPAFRLGVKALRIPREAVEALASTTIPTASAR